MDYPKMMKSLWDGAKKAQRRIEVLSHRRARFPFLYRLFNPNRFQTINAKIEYYQEMRLAMVSMALAMGRQKRRKLKC